MKLPSASVPRRRGERSSIPRHRARGLTLVDMLIGLAIGLFVVSQGLILLAAHLHENKAVVLEARLMQDLRAASSAVARNLRRAGYWGDATAALRLGDSAPRSNPYQAITTSPSPIASVRIHYSRDASENHVVDGNEEFGFRLRNQAIDSLLAGTWQTLTDVGTVRVTSLRLTPVAAEVELPLLCDRPCPPATAGSPVCPPRIEVRRFVIDISAESTIDPAIKRTLQTTARVRNDAVTGVCAP